MLSNSDLIDQVNPFIDNLPGALYKPYEFGSYKELIEPPYKEGSEPSSICETMLTAGDKTIDWCQPGVPNCPMSRELEPTQKVDPDISYEDGVFVPFSKTSSDETYQILVKILIILLIIALILIVAEKL